MHLLVYLKNLKTTLIQHSTRVTRQLDNPHAGNKVSPSMLIAWMKNKLMNLYLLRLNSTSIDNIIIDEIFFFLL